jgi:glycosyltransferase involved in cell wall biosynthesis
VEKKSRILFFVGGLNAGGKERRLVELMFYLKNRGNYEMAVVVTNETVHYKRFFELGIPLYYIKKGSKFSFPKIFFELNKIVKEFNPDIIHVWGRLQAFYSLPAIKMQGTPMVNSQITSAPPASSFNLLWRIIDRMNFENSAAIVSNSYAGIEAYQPPMSNVSVVYNGLNMERFKNLPIQQEVKCKYSIKTKYAVVMAATFTDHKDYDLFLKVADFVTKARPDVTFIGIGEYVENEKMYFGFKSKYENNDRILLPGKITDVEALVNACDIGVLFSNVKVHGEGISNSVLEYMALGKPVIANDAGGTKEIVLDKVNGFLVRGESVSEIAGKISFLLDNDEQRSVYGEAGKEMVYSKFALNRMGEAFENIYKKVNQNKKIVT